MKTFYWWALAMSIFFMAHNAIYNDEIKNDNQQHQEQDNGDSLR